MSSTPYIFPISYPSRGPVQQNWPAYLQTSFFLLLFLCIFIAESQTAFGADHTSQPLLKLFQSLFGSSVNQHWSELHHILRKTGHFVAFGTFSLICLRGLRQTLQGRISSLNLHALAVFSTTLIASADELHQAFLPNRSGSLHDVLLDTAGALTIQLTVYFLCKF